MPIRRTNRRIFIAALGGAAVWPLVARAQQQERVRRLGVLMGIANDLEGHTRVAAFQTALQKLGWIVGHNIRIDYRWVAGDADQARADATEVVGLKPDVILANGTAPVAALRRAAATVPIVIVVGLDSCEKRFVACVAWPCGKVTGVTSFEPGLGGH